MVKARIIKTELKPVILTPISLFRARIVSVTTAIDRPKERASLSTIFICRRLKNTSVQANPGRKNTSIKLKITLTAGTLSRNGRVNPMSSLIEASQSTLYGSSLCQVGISDE